MTEGPDPGELPAAPNAQSGVPTDAAAASSPAADVAEQSPQRRRYAAGTALMAIGIAGLVACLALVVGTWWFRGFFVERTDALVTSVEGAFDRGAEVAASIGTQVDDATEAAGEIRAQALQVAAATARTTIADLRAAIDERLGERFTQIRDGLIATRERVTAVVQTARRLERLIPGLDLPDPATDALATVDQRLTELDAATSALRQTASADDSDPRGTARAIAGSVGTIETAMAGLGTGVASVQSGLETAATETAAAGERIAGYATLAAIILTIGLAYLAILHLIVVIMGRNWRRG